MSNEQKRITIAEACGWTAIHKGLWVESMQTYAAIPDYLNDLNAMHEAEKSLTQEQRDNFRFHLMRECGGEAAYHATASQRADAFLKTIGKL